MARDALKLKEFMKEIVSVQCFLFMIICFMARKGGNMNEITPY